MTEQYTHCSSSDPQMQRSDMIPKYYLIVTTCNYSNNEFIQYSECDCYYQNVFPEENMQWQYRTNTPESEI